MATLGKNQVFEIKNGDGTSFHNLVLRKSAVESVVMSLGDKISGDVYYKDNSLSVTMHEYITYNGVNYMLVNPPTIVREGIVSDNSELKGMTKYSFVFYHPMCQLANFPFSDVAVTSDETRYLSEGKTFSWIGKPADFVAKLNKNLTGTEWIVELSSRFPQDKLDELSDVIPFDNATIADACKTFYDVWGVPYVVDKVASTEASYAAGKRFKLVMGLPSNEIYENAAAEQQNTPFVFQMGHGVGLKNNSRTPRNNKIITRISGYGSENNIPYGYPQVRWYGTAGQAFTYGDHAGLYTDVTIDGVHLDKVISYPIYKGILDGEYVELIKHPFTRAHLMPSVYRTCLFNKISFLDDNGEFNTDYDPDITLVDYYDAVYSSQYPYPNTINLQAPSYESHEFEDEKPELREAHIISTTPLNNDLTPASSWDDSLDDEGNYKQSYFQMVLPQLSFDLYACASITEEMQINMRSGTCLGCTFTVQVDWDDYKRNFYDDEGNFAPNGSQRDLTKYPKSNQGSISLVLQKDNSTFGTLMPNMYQYPKGETSVGAGDGDMFVILGISLPESYIFAAEWRLDADMKSYMLENNVHYFDYPLKFDEDFLFHNENILSQIHPNTVVRFNYAGQIQSLFVKQITVKYGDQPLPQYDITLTDNVEVVLNQIGQVAEDVEKLSTLIAILRQSYGKNVWNELAKKLSKTQDDTAAGYITMLKGLQVGANFVPDILGEGGVLRMRDDGKVELVTDILYARVKAYFDSVEIREYQHTGGNRIASVAGNKICRVAWFNSSNVELEQTQANLASVAYFRCYFRASDGEDTVRNNWLVGDQAYCHITSVTTSSDNPEQKGLNQKHLWRLVIGRNTEGTLTEDGEAYIDLSNRATETISGTSYTGYQSGSDIPEAQDDIIQLGNVNDTTRQGAIVEFVTGTDAPSYQIYQGINSFSLNGKNQITIGYNTATGKADMKVYGDAYIGARDRSTFIEFKQDDGTEQHNPVLNIKAHVEFTNSNQELDAFVQSHQRDDSYDDTEVRGLIDGLQDQIDGQIESWFYNYAPVAVDSQGAPTSNVPSNVEPYKSWNDADVAAGNDAQKIAHLGDTFTNNKTGYCWRFTRNSSTNAFEWVIIEDSAVITALQNAARAQDTADHKRRVFLSQPVPPYDAGDMWVNAVYPANYTGVTDEANHNYNNDILKCVTAKASDGSFSINDWALASKYTDDSKFNGYISALLNNTGISGDSAAAAVQNAILGALGVGTVVAGGLLLTSLIGMRQYNGSGDKTDVANYTTWAGISGQYNANVLGGGMAAWYGGGMLDKETLTTQQILQGWNTLRWAKGVDRFDGSGYRADGNISWNANGALTIKNITTLSDSNNNNILNELATFNSAFTFGTSGQGSTTALYITPQVPFEELYIGTSNADKQEVATKNWVNQNFVTTTFFDNLFRVYNGAESAANKIAVNGTLPTDKTNLNIEAMFGFWTKKYISALGQGDDGTTSYTTLAQLNDVTLTNPTANQVLSYNGTHWVNRSIELGSQTLADLTDVVITSPAANQMLGYDATNQKWINVNVPETYTLPAASTTALGGIKIGYSGTTAKTYAVVLDSGNKAYVSVPWENTWTAWAGATSTAAGTAGYMPAPTSAQRNQFLRGDGTWVNLNNYSLPTASADTLGGVKVGTTLAIASGVLNLATTSVTAGTYRSVTVDDYGRVTGGTNPTTLSGYGITDALQKLTYEYSKEITFGSTGKLLIGKFPCYNSNVTIYLDATTNTTYHATIILATQNINNSHGGAIHFNVYGDETNSVAPNLYLYYPSNSRYIEIYFSPSAWSKNIIHIKCSALQSAPTNICESVSEIPSNATTQPTNVLNASASVNYATTAGAVAWGNITSKPTALGGSTQPVYWNGSGFTACTSYANASVASADKLTTARTINGTSFDGSANITTENWGTARNVSIADSDSTNTGSAVSVNGSAAVTLKLPSTIKATLSGNATSASKLTTVSKTAWGQTFWTSGGVPTSISGALSSVTNITMSGYIKIGDAYLSYDSTNNAIRVSANADGTGAMNFYARGGVSALGETADGQAGVGDVTWALLADGTDTRQIALSHLTTSLTTITGGTTDSTNKKYAVYKNSSNQLFVDVPWTAGSGTVTSVKVGTTSYTPTNGVISLPAYPTVPTKVSQLTNDSGYITSYTNTWRNIYVSGTEKLTTAITTKGLNFAAGSNVSLSFAAAGTGSGQSGNANFGTITISATDTTYSVFTASANGLVPMASSGNKTTAETAVGNYYLCADGKFRQLPANAFLNNTYTLAGLMGSSAKGSTTQPIYWNGSAFANTTYTLGKSVPSDAVFTDHYAWSDITGKPSSFTPSAHNHSYIEAKGVYTFDSSTLPNSFDLGVSAGFVNSNSGFGSYGSVLTVRTFSGGGGTLQLYAPYSNTYGGSHLKARFGDYGTSSGNSWTALKDVAWVSDIPTKVSQLTNDSGFVTSSGVTSVATGTGLTGGTITTSGTISINSTYQTYISHGESAYNSLGNYIPKHNISGTSATLPTWGTLTAGNGYSAGAIWNFPGGSDLAFAYKSGQVSMQVDGYFYQNEGRYRVIDTSDVSGLSVNYASSAGNADTVDGYHANKTGDSDLAAFHTFSASGDTLSFFKIGTLPTVAGTGYGESYVIFELYNFINFGGNSPSKWVVTASSRGSYSLTAVNVIGSDEIYVGYVVANDRMEIWVGTSSTFMGQSRVRVDSSSNFTADFYKTTTKPVGWVDGVSEYLITSAGGTMTGILKVKTGYGISDASDNGLLVYHPADWTGVSSSQWGVGSTDSIGVIRSDDHDLVHYRYGRGNSYIIDDTGGTLKGSLSFNYNNHTLRLKTTSESAGIDVPSVDEWLIRTDDTNTQLMIGNVGIGVYSPSEKLHVNGNVKTSTDNGTFVQIGAIRLQYDSSNNAIKVVKSDGTAANLYATGGVSALGAGQESGGGGNYLPLSGGTMTGSINSAYYCLSYSSTNPYLELIGAGITTYVQNYQGSMYIGYGVSNSIKIDSDATLTTKNILVTDGSTGDSPYIEFRRGTNADDFTDWRIRDSGGDLSFYPKSLNSNWPKIAWLGGDGVWNGRGFSNTSDIRKKNVIKDVDLRLDQIAKAPAFEYYWLDPSIDHDLHVGTSAQYWQSVLPEVVSRAKDEMGTLSMQYGVAALISAIMVARKVMTHEEKIALLETRVSALEKENGEQEMLINSLQAELAKFKAA